MTGRLRLRALAALLVLSCLSAPRGAAAESDRAEGPSTRRWYGFQILAADAALIAIAQMDGMEGALWGLALTGPVVHVSHRRWSVAGWSLVLRTAVPVMSVVVASGVCDSREQSVFGDHAGCLSDALLGAVVGYGVATIIDASLLSIERAPAAPAILPIVRVGSSRASVGLGFTF